ncbi:hypothetical protein AB4G91_01420 [Macrococcoides goetzii]|uniref:hypothetical protein n=1 Tax=Macrococcus sp. PK TaxID=2801919 RepID=UPI001F0EBA04|nr:hypothetical protein [Macrococcus sp. PK]MCH4983956.1 hypothetical protein [Macrococcus sp. PK]
MEKEIIKVSSSVKMLQVGSNGIAKISLRSRETGGTRGPLRIYDAYSSNGNLLGIEGFFEDDMKIEYKQVRPERQPTIFDYFD